MKRRNLYATGCLASAEMCALHEGIGQSCPQSIPRFNILGVSRNPMSWFRLALALETAVRHMRHRPDGFQIHLSYEPRCDKLCQLKGEKPMNAWEKWKKRPQIIWLRRALFQVHLWTGIGLGIYVLLM